MWYQLHISRLTPEQIEALSEMLENLGALSISLSDQNDHPLLEPAPETVLLWPETRLSALFHTEDEALLAQKISKEAYPDKTMSVESLADQAWERVCMDQFQAQAFGGKLWVCPSWCAPPEPEAVNLYLDPGLAFGTGTHPTTGLCLEWLTTEELRQKSVIDYGCGSGILGIAARKLGAEWVHAVDIDPQALSVTEENAVKNACLDEKFKISTPENLQTPADVLLANILLGPLRELRDTFANLLLPDGTLVVSGLLENQREDLIHHYQDVFHCHTQTTIDEWAMIVFRKRY